MGHIGTDGCWTTDDITEATQPAINVASPTRFPFKCPVCEGRQSMPSGFYYPPINTDRQPCLTCHGTGIIWSDLA